MRGVVSLAAALSIPVQLSDGHPFPQRNLILFITFIVILLTLLIQGLTLPYVIRKIKLPDFGDNLPEEEAENIIRKELAEQALSHLGSVYSEQLKDHPALQQMAAKWASHTNMTESEEIGKKNKNIYRIF
jgi:CPA1 family monovalent cation:H+ antiporter